MITWMTEKKRIYSVALAMIVVMVLVLIPVRLTHPSAPCGVAFPDSLGLLITCLTLAAIFFVILALNALCPTCCTKTPPAVEFKQFQEVSMQFASISTASPQPLAHPTHIVVRICSSSSVPIFIQTLTSTIQFHKIVDGNSEHVSNTISTDVMRDLLVGDPLQIVVDISGLQLPWNEGVKDWDLSLNMVSTSGTVYHGSMHLTSG
jgi:hypothetical protein